MDKDKDTQKTSPNAGKEESELNLTFSRDATVRPVEVKTTKVKKGIWRTYDATDGLPGDPYHLHQGKWGYLWIGTREGLCRYDGREFITYTPADGLDDKMVQAFCEDSQGRLWIGTKRGLSCFDGKQLIHCSLTDKMAGKNVKSLCIDNQDRLWIGTVYRNGLFSFDGDSLVNYSTDAGLPDNQIYALCVARNGGIWMVNGHGFSFFDGQSFANYTFANYTIDKTNWFSNVYEDSRGLLWITTGYRGQGVYSFDGKQLRHYTHEDGLRQGRYVMVYEDHRGRLWCGGYPPGLFCFDGHRFINYTSADDMSYIPTFIFDMLEDREGRIWLAHGQMSYLSCCDEESIQLITDQPATLNVAQDRDGRFWYGSGNNLHAIYFDTESSEAQERNLSFGERLTGLMIDSSNRLWVSEFQNGLYCYDSADAAWRKAGGEEMPESHHFSRTSGYPWENNIVPQLEEEDGTIWFAWPIMVGDRFEINISLYDAEQFMDGEPLESIRIERFFWCLIKDSQGRLWKGADLRDGLSCWNGKEWVNYTQEDGFQYDIARDGICSLMEDDHGQIWIGMNNNLCCFDGERFTNYGEEHGLRGVRHSRSAKDISGNLWFATRGGVYRYDGKHFQWLTGEDGLPSNNVTGLLPQSDGSMIICTLRGIVRYQPTATVPPRVEIREVVADKVYQNPEELDLTTTAANLLTISYRGLSLSTRKMRYSYILEGHNQNGREGWHETWEHQVRYENLPVGEYTFKVIAINRDLVTSESPAILRLKVVPDPRDVMVTELRSDLEVKNQQLIFLKREMEQKYEFEEIIGESEGIGFVRAQMSYAIDNDVNVLITGETGTGKELVAKGIHYNSPRKDKMYLPRNCSSIPKDLAESILFGHRKGAFTDAKEDQMGLFEIASGGTVVLDEIGDMPIDIQPVLLRVLDERKFHRVGEENILRELDIRIISITNRDILEDVKTNRFRKDLYYRLNRFKIYVPPLRERRDDIPLLAEHFYQKACQERRKELDGFAPEVIDMLTSYDWPGNVRELQNEIEYACILAQKGSRIHTYHFSPEITQGESLAQEIMSERLSYRESVKQFRRQLVERALQECDGNRTQAARLLGIGRSNLIHLIKDLKVDE